MRSSNLAEQGADVLRKSVLGNRMLHMENKNPVIYKRILIFLALIWLGMVLGISFLEAPVKFRAPTLTRSVGLDVGRHVFGFFNKVEIGSAFEFDIS